MLALDREAGGTEPIPSYDAWPDERMARDIKRMARAGIDIVFTAVDAGDLSDRLIRARYRRFLDVTQRSGYDINVAFVLTDLKAPREQLHKKRLYGWLLSLNIRDSSCYLSRQGNPLVLVNHPAGSHLHHPGLRFQGVGRGTPWVWPGQRSASELVSPPYAGEQGVAVAGDPALDRNHAARARMFRRTFRTAAAKGPRYLCIFSWNNYRQARFIEHNSLDWNKMYNLVAQEVSLLKTRGKTE